MTWVVFQTFFFFEIRIKHKVLKCFRCSEKLKVPNIWGTPRKKFLTFFDYARKKLYTFRIFEFLRNKFLTLSKFLRRQFPTFVRR
jgi:hypothetical protein